MPHIVVKCTGCKTKYKLSADLAGKKVKCRKCQTPILVKAPTPSPDDVEEPDDDDDFDSEFDDSPPVKQRKPVRTLGKLKPARKAPAAKAATKPPATTSINRPLIAMIAGTALVLVAAAVFVIPKLIGRASASAKIDAPAEFEKYQDQDSAVWFDYPAGWSVSHGGGKGGVPAWAKIEWEKIRISIRDSITGSAIGDIAGAATANAGDAPPELQPVHAVHMFRLQQIQAENPDYEETEPEIFKTQMGEGRLAEFIKPEMFGKKYGYRATLPPRVKQFTVTCECSQAEFEILKDTFRRIIASCSRGPG